MNEPLRVQLEFDAARDAMAGTLSSGSDRQRFSGWLGLMAALENAVGRWQGRPGEVAAADGDALRPPAEGRGRDHDAETFRL
jgi:hypothetical protein